MKTRIKWTLFVTQAFGSAGFVVASTVTPIVGADLARRAAWAGVPTAFYWGGGALFAMVWGRLMDPLGRRRTLALGLLVGVVGATVAAAAIGARSFPVFVSGLVLMGAANAALQLARFVSGEVHPVAERGRAIATVVMGGTVGAVFGPALVAPMSVLATEVGRPGMVGPFAASAFFFLLGSGFVAALLRPEPRDLAAALGAQTTATSTAAEPTRTIREISADSAVRSATIAMICSQAVMTMLMVITSLEMSHNHHSLAGISSVMSAHVVGMFGFSIISGRLADRWGRGPLMAAGGLCLVVAGLVASRAVQVLPLAGALWLLGLGWNFVYVGGSTLLSDRLTAAERSRVQGLNDALVTGTAAVGSLLSGVVFANLGYATMGLVCSVVALVPLWLGRRVARITAPGRLVPAVDAPA
ncbi:MAG: MFS transporter [Gemmatimonadales bacterium]